MSLTSRQLNCGYMFLPYIINGTENANLTNTELEQCKHAIALLAHESDGDRLKDNYTRWLHLDKMHYYSFLWDCANNKPVMGTGAQRITSNCCRLFSRYFLYKDYRTVPHKTTLYDKVDNFETDLLHLELVWNDYPFIFWSRDKGTGFFKKLKDAKPSVFYNWTVHDIYVPIMYSTNVQGIIYTGSGSNTPDPYIDELLFK